MVPTINDKETSEECDMHNLNTVMASDGSLTSAAYLSEVVKFGVVSGYSVKVPAAFQWLMLQLPANMEYAYVKQCNWTCA